MNKDLYDGLIIKPSLDELYHHGVQGQKWGVKHGPPYPLSRQKKKGSGRLVGKKFNPKHAKSKEFHDKEVELSWSNSNNVAEIEERRLRSTGENVYLWPAGVIRDFERDLGKNPYPTNYKEDFDTAVRRVNPDYGERGTTKNCTRCAAAMELRNKGYDVVAARAHNGASAFEYETWFKGAKTKGYDSAEECKRDLLRQGDGASGALNGYFGEGLGSGSGGHALHWSIKGRHVEIQDGQSGELFGSFDEAWDHYGFDNGACFATRLDNCDPNWDAMMEDSVIGVNNGFRKWEQNQRIFDRF